MLSNTDQLKDRINVKKHQLLARLGELQADTRKEAAAARASVQRKLADLDDALGDGWDNLTEAAAKRLNEWLD
jgi:hypothetical protein